MLLVGGVAFLISTDHSTTASVIFSGNAGALVPGINSPATTTTTTTIQWLDLTRLNTEMTRERSIRRDRLVYRTAQPAAAWIGQRHA